MTACPNCGSRYLRPAQTRSLKERLNTWLFIAPLRCLDCKHRFVARTVTWSDLKFARCPTCLRPDLNAWSGNTYEPSFWMGVKISFGGYRWRCEYCRLNFVSFRKRKEVFTFSRWKKMSLPGLPGPAETPEAPQAAKPGRESKTEAV